MSLDEAAVKEFIENKINHDLKIHAAGCEFVKIEDDCIYIKLFGGCSGCPSSGIALFNNIEPLFREKFPGMQELLLT